MSEKYATANATDFEAYWEARGKELPGTTSPTQIDAALLVASEWIDRTYRNLFIGEKTAGFLQDREWPRVNAVIWDRRYSHVYPSNEIPDKVIQAVYEAAYRELVQPGSLLVDWTPNKYRSVSIDGAVSVDYAMFSSAADVQKSFPIIDQILAPLMDPNAYGSSSYSSDICGT